MKKQQLNNKTLDEDDLVPRTAPKPNQFEAQVTAKPDVPDLTLIQPSSSASSCNALPSLTSHDYKICENAPPVPVLQRNEWPIKGWNAYENNIPVHQKQISNNVQNSNSSIPKTIVYQQNKAKSDNNCDKDQCHEFLDSISVKVPTQGELSKVLENFVEYKIKSQIKQQLDERLSGRMQQLFEQQQPQQQKQQQQQESHQIDEHNQTIKNEQIFEFLSQINLRMDSFEKKLQQHMEILENRSKVKNNEKMDKSIQCDIGNESPNTEHYIIDFAGNHDEPFAMKRVTDSSCHSDVLTHGETDRNALMENLRRKYLSIKEDNTTEESFSYKGVDSNKSRKQQGGNKERK